MKDLIIAVVAAEVSALLSRALLDRGLDENHRDSCGWEPLRHATVTLNCRDLVLHPVTSELLLAVGREKLQQGTKMQSCTEVLRFTTDCEIWAAAWPDASDHHIVRGDNICVVGEIDEDIDSRLELHNMKAEPINSVPHGI